MTARPATPSPSHLLRPAHAAASSLLPQTATAWRRWCAGAAALVALQLAGCSWLPLGREDEEQSADAPTQTERSEPSFALQVHAPDSVRALLEQHLELQRFRQLPDLQPHELERLLTSAQDNARELVATLGYFDPDITVTLEPAGAAQGPATSLPTISVTVLPGTQTTVARADIALLGDRTADPALERRQTGLQRRWTLREGAGFTQSDWDSAKADGLRSLRERRYPAAQLTESLADIDPELASAELSVRYQPGPPHTFGTLQMKGLERYDETGLRNLARLPKGEEYSEQALLDAQQRLANSGYFDAVFLALEDPVQDPNAATVVAQVREAPLKKVVYGVGFSTDNGPRVSLDHTHNRIPWLGWRALSKIALDRDHQLLSSEITGLPHEKGWRWFSGAALEREKTADYFVYSGRLRWGRSKSEGHIDRTMYLQYDFANTSGLEQVDNSSSITANYGWTGRYFNNLTSPTRGWGVALEAGAGMTLRPQRDPFLRLSTRWQHFVPLGRVVGESGRGRFARLSLRAEGGAVIAREGATIPITQLFLTGGDTTVRGYGYRSIGARTDGDQLYGGRYLASGSVEWQRPIVLASEVSDFESALFLDVGGVGEKPGDISPKVGLGAGVRWNSPVGPVQADLAWGVQAERLRLHLRMGFSF